jgi:hypothetical protein
VHSSLLADRLRQRGKLERTLVRAEGAAIASVLSDYATARLRPYNVLRRFARYAWSAYKFRDRSRAYTRRTSRSPGGSRPFVSPDHVPIDGPKMLRLLAITAGGNLPGALLQLSRMLQDAKPSNHAYGRVVQPGTGHQVRVRVSKGAAQADLTFPAMRALNRHPEYAAEFRRLSSPQEFAALKRAVQERSSEAIAKILTAHSQQKKPKRRRISRG